MQYFYLLHALLHGIFIVSPLIVLAIITKLLIIHKQVKHAHGHSNVLKNLTIGSHITTYDGKQGFIINYYQHSVVIELANGEKIEIQHYAIQSLR